MHSPKRAPQPQKCDELDRLTKAQRAWVARRQEVIVWKATRSVLFFIGGFMLLSATKSPRVSLARETQRDNAGVPFSIGDGFAAG